MVCYEDPSDSQRYSDFQEKCCYRYKSSDKFLRVRDTAEVSVDEMWYHEGEANDSYSKMLGHDTQVQTWRTTLLQLTCVKSSAGYLVLLV